jgi:two-component system cell cycle sensor histidine kinase/response regulator CckA
MPQIPKPRLLIVDDSLETVVGLRCFFSSRYDVYEAHSGAEGMRLLATADRLVDLVISDLLMPGVSGVSFILSIKAQFPGIPVIAVTGWVEDPERLAALTNADLILYKPFELEILDAHVGRLLGNR